MANKGQESHIFYLNRLPADHTYADYRKAYAEPLDSLLNLWREGKISGEQGKKKLKKLTPAWTHDLPYVPKYGGGMGLVAPGRTGQATQKVKPGHYVMTCDIRNAKGRIHYTLGMRRGITVVSNSSVKHSPPAAEIAVKGVENKIQMDDTLGSGTQTVSFSVKKVPKNLPDSSDGYYMVWLASLGDTTTAKDIEKWDDKNPAPYQGLGGFSYRPLDQTAYITADFKPGRYAWLWFYEGMDSSNRPLVKEFTVRDGYGQ